MHVCVVSIKKCWQDEHGTWMASGGFPAQMAGIRTLFDSMTLVVVQGVPGEGGNPLPAGAEVIALPRPRGQNLLRKLAVVAGLPGYLRAIIRAEKRADVVHTPIPGDVAILGFLVALLLNKPLLARYCSAWGRNTQTTRMNTFTKWLMRRFAGGKRVMLVTGTGEKPPAPGVHWIFSSIISRAELNEVHPNLERGVSRPPRLIYAGRLSVEKGLATLMDSLAILRREGSLPNGLSVTLAGDGPQRAELEKRVAENDLGDWVSFAGMLSRADLLDCLLESDAMLLPSYTESFSKARLDGMLCGLPVISTSVGHARSIMGADGEVGWIVEPHDAEGLAQAIRTVVSQPHDWPALRRRCRQAVDRFTLEGWAEEIGRIAARQWGVPYSGGKLTV